MKNSEKEFSKNNSEKFQKKFRKIISENSENFFQKNKL
jgi:hypothetical protein